jgi:putative transposase
MTQKHNPIRYFKTSPEIIRLAVMLYVRFPLSLRNVEDLLHERGVDISYETVRFWWQGLRRTYGAESHADKHTGFRSSANWWPTGLKTRALN